MSSVTAPPEPSMMEVVACYHCGSTETAPFVVAQDDYTGKPGRFTFVRCAGCGLVYQSPRIRLEHIRAWYDDEYIAHRKKTDWGILTPLYRRAMEKHDREKERLVSRFVSLSPETRVLDVGCGSGAFLNRLRRLHGCSVTGVDFKDLKSLPSMEGVDFRCGLFYEQELPADHFDLVTMWHFLEHDYDPMRTLAEAKRVLKPDGRLGFIVPAGLATDHGCAALRRELLGRTTLDMFLTLENRQAIFPVHRGLKFALFTLTAGGSTNSVPIHPGMRDPAMLDRIPDNGRDPHVINLPRPLIDRISSDQAAIPEIRSAADLVPPIGT